MNWLRRLWRWLRNRYDLVELREDRGFHLYLSCTDCTVCVYGDWD